MKKPLQNMLAAGAADAISRLFGFLVTAYLARTLGKGAFGELSIGVAVLGYVMLTASPGLHIMGVRRIAAYEGIQRLWTSHVTLLRLLLALAGVLVAAAVTYAIMGLSPAWVVVLLFCLSALPMALSLEWYFQGKSDIVVVSASRVLLYCVYLPLTLLLVSDPGDASWAAAAFGAGNVVSALWLLFLFTRRSGGLQLRWNPAAWRGLLRESLPLGGSSVLAQTVVNLPVLIVGVVSGSGETGVFSAAMRLIFFILMIDRVFYTLFLPVVSRYRAADPEKFARAAGLGMRVVLLVALPVMALGFVYADLVIGIVYGSGYLESAPVLKALMPYFLFTVINTVAMSVLYADHRESEFLRVLFLGTAVLAILILALTFQIGAQGAAIGLSAGEGFMTLLLVLRTRATTFASSLGALAGIGGAALLMAAALWLAAPAGPLVAVPLGVVVFAGAALASGGLSREDVRFLRERFV